VIQVRTTDLKRLANLAQWKERVAECRSSGMKVREWCEAQGICVQTYYRWERCVLSAASGQLQAQNENSTSITPAPKPVFAELTPVKSSPPVRRTENVVATIRCGAVSIDFYADADPSLIVALCKELQYA